MQTYDNLNKFKYLAPIIIFGLIFVFHTYPMGLSDYWWHMSSGRWIFEHLAIPTVDHFTYTVPQDDELRRKVILKAYYLGQLSFYFIYTWFGVWGLLIYKSVLLTLPFLLLWRYLCYKKVESMSGLVLIAILPFLLFRFDELRAVVFSFIGAVALLFLIEKFIDQLKMNQPVRIYYFLIPITMLLWSNLHRGFLIGWVLLAGYLFAESIDQIRKTSSLNALAYKKLGILFVVSIVVSILNPNGLDPVIANFSELKGPFSMVVDEFFTLWAYSKLYGAEFIFYGCLAISIFGGYFMLRSWRDLNPVHPLLMVGFIVQGFSTFRFSYFLAVMVLALAAPYYSETSQRIKTSYPALLFTMLVAVIVALGYFSSQRTALIYGPWENAYVPTAAVQYVMDKKPPGNIFNAFEYGGYLGWKLYPDYKIFIDQRNLDYAVYQEYAKARNGQYQAVFNKYDVNIVIFYVTQPVLNKVPPVVAKLLYDIEWQVVFVDKRSIVFVRTSMAAGVAVLNKQQVIDYVNNLLVK